MSTFSFSRRWAATLIEAIKRHGVQHICIAPGSRSTPLTLAATTAASVTLHTHFDERGLAYLALGIAKTSGAPVAIIVTSGTALANLYPAVIEAGLTGEKLILLTADRPPELINCGANQAIEQPGLFSSHVSGTLNLPCPSEAIPARWLVSAVDNLLGQQQAGAVHINCPFADPLYGEDDGSDTAWQQTLGNWWHTDTPWLRTQSPARSVAQPDWSSWRQQHGVVVAGRISASQGQRLAVWAQQLGWPLLGDVLSQTGQPLPCADLWLSTSVAQKLLAQANIVVQFGSSLTGKRLLQWQASCQPDEYWLVDKLSDRRDPAQHRGRRLVADIDDWLDAHPPVLRQPWALPVASLARQTYQQVARQLTEFGEAQLAHRLTQLLPPDGQLFLGNSLVIRLTDALGQLPAGYPVYANRGASGIDGLIATSVGVQRATQRRTLTLAGDLSTLYDINSLALLREPMAPYVLIVINNNGGQIFSLLDTPAHIRQQFYCMPQHIDFQHAAALFRLNYRQPANWQQLEHEVHQAFVSPPSQATLIELCVAPQQGVQQFRQLLNLVNS